MRRPPSKQRREQLLDRSPSDVFPELRDSGDEGGDGSRKEGSSSSEIATRRFGTGSLRTLPSSVTIIGGVRDRFRVRRPPWSHRPLALARGLSGESASP